MGKLGISHQNSDKGCNCKLFFLLLPFHFALLPASVSLSYLHFFTNIDFIQEQKCFSFWTRQILISTFTHPNTSTFSFTVNYSSKFIPNFSPFLYFMLRPSHCNGLIDNTYISILNCHFSPISLQNGWISTFVLWCQMLASQIGCLKIFITFPSAGLSADMDEKSPPGQIFFNILFLRLTKCYSLFPEFWILC